MPEGPDKLPVTDPWRQRAIEAFDELPQGKKQECAAFAGCSPALISRILGGDVDASEHVALISEFLKIPPPVVRVDTLKQVELLEKARQLSPDDLDLLIANANRLNR